MIDEPEHSVPLWGGWRVWRDVLLRGTGFPIEGIAVLHGNDAATAVDALEAPTAARAAAAARLRGLCVTRVQAKHGADARPWQNALRAIDRGELPKLPDDPEVRSLADELQRRHELLDAELERARSTYQVACRRISDGLKRLAADDRFREAVTWQSRHAVVTGLDPFVTSDPLRAGSSDVRQKEQLVARYAQRYFLKNDTIGFFGPVGWARFTTEGDPLAIRPGAGLVSRREVFFERWGIEILAAHLASDVRLRRYFAPRRSPLFRQAGTSVFPPMGGPQTLSAGQAATLAACDGDRTAMQIATLLGVPEPEVLGQLDELRRNGLVTWTLELPSIGLFPLDDLRRIVEPVVEAELRQSALAAIAELEAARRRVGAAAGKVGELHRELEALDASFHRLTGAEATRPGTKMYTGRTLVYEDCVRDGEVELGPEIRQRLSQPLGLLLESARWFTFEMATRYRTALTAIHERLASQLEVREVPLLPYWGQAMSLFGKVAGDKSQAAPLHEVRAEFQRRWAGVLAIDDFSVREIKLTSAALAASVREAFRAPGPGWPSAQQQSPDVMISARGADAVRRGEYELVLGELHLGMNTVANLMFSHLHPDRERLRRAMASDLPPRIGPTIPKRFAIRTMLVDMGADDLEFEALGERSWRKRDEVVSAADLVIAATGTGVLEVRTRDGRRRWDIIAFFDTLLVAHSNQAWQLLPPMAHTPRVVIDSLVVTRESWRFDGQMPPWQEPKDRFERYVTIRRWAQAQGLPREVFVRTSTELKPMYIDFGSPSSIEYLAKLARDTQFLSISEMLPTTDQVWLPDRDGKPYSSELRIVAVDPLPWCAG